MARSKPQTPVRRTPSETFKQANGTSHTLNDVIENVEKEIEDAAEVHARDPVEQKQAGLGTLLFCVGGIYASFITWGVIQERLTTTTHGPQGLRFKYPIFLNTVQSSFAAMTGYLYLLTTSPRDPKTGKRQIPPIFPDTAILPLLFLVAVTTSLASPFGYASLKHIDYVTFILAKSCKLLPVMALHISLFQKKYPMYKYMVVICVTLGVSVFTLHNPSVAKKAAKKAGSADPDASRAVGLFLLGVNLLFDGLTNTVQDNIFTKYKGRISGPQMMCASNIMCTALTLSYLLLQPFLASSPLGSYIGLSSTSAGEFNEAWQFVRAFPAVGLDVLGFAACGAVGQVFIFATLAHFSSLLLVTVTVTRKMLTMLFSVFMFGHTVTPMQWLGVGLVFGGIGAEAEFTRREKKAKMKVVAKKEL